MLAGLPGIYQWLVLDVFLFLVSGLLILEYRDFDDGMQRFTRVLILASFGIYFASAVHIQSVIVLIGRKNEIKEELTKHKNQNAPGADIKSDMERLKNERAYLERQHGWVRRGCFVFKASMLFLSFYWAMCRSLL